MEDALLVDLDVEEPNCYLFQRQPRTVVEKVLRPVPAVDRDRCTLCGKCGEVCEFHAIVPLPKEVMVFSELCHGCGACSELCPEGAIREVGHLVGDVVKSTDDKLDLLFGRLRVGEAMPTYLIREVRGRIPATQHAVLDCPPGTSCSSVESVREADLCLLVAEPTPFGLHDLALAIQMTSKLGVRVAVFINKHGLPGPDIDAYCAKKGVPVIGRLPMDRRIAERYSRGELVSTGDGYRSTFESLRASIEEMVGT